MKRIYLILFASLFLWGCANRGMGPQGGPKDSIPPVPVKSVPENGALEFKGKRIEVTFNENLQLDNISQNLLMSPPQQRAPEVKARGKHLVVLFTDTLQDSTTYTLDFGDAVCDYTEKNPFHNYTFSFSTGSVIDTLEVNGFVFDAANLNPAAGIIVGIHSNKDDSAFTTLPFARIARSDSVGAFKIGNMRDGTYRIYAVKDVSRDNRLTTGEELAFADAMIQAGDSAVLWLFKPEQQRLYLQRTVREEQHMIKVFFSSTPDSMPSFRALPPSAIDSTRADSTWIDPTPFFHTAYSKQRDTLTIWLTDSVAIAQDSIFLEAHYRRTDSVFNLEWNTDTLRAIWRAPRLSAKAQKAKAMRDRKRKLSIKSNARKGFEIFDTLRITSATPLADIQRDSIHLFERIDTLSKPVPFTIAPYDTLPMELKLIATLGAGKKYELRLDSAAFHDVYGLTHNIAKYPLEVKTPEDYSTLRVKLNPYLPKARIQVLNARDQVVRELPANENGALFEYLKPDGYYMRLYLDENGDGKWTTGSWEAKRQPEPIYYFPSKIQTKSNWDFEEEWDYTAVPQTESKPAELIQAAPKKK